MARTGKGASTAARTKLFYFAKGSQEFILPKKHLYSAINCPKERKARKFDEIEKDLIVFLNYNYHGIARN